MILGTPAAVYLIPQSQNEALPVVEARGLLSGLSERAAGPADVQRIAKAHHLLTRYLERGGSKVDTARLLLCIAAAADESLSESASYFRQVDPARCEVLDMRAAALVLFAKGQGAAADSLLVEALQRESPASVREKVLRAAITIRYDLGQENEVVDHCNELIKLAPEDERPWMVLALSAENKGKWELAVSHYREVLRRVKEDDAPYRRVLTDFLVRAGNAKEARQEFDALKTANGAILEEFPLLEARLLKLEGRDEDALAVATEVIASLPESAEAHLLRGQILYSQTKFDDAVEALEKSAELDPLSHQAQYLLGVCYLRVGQGEKSKQHFLIHSNLAEIKKKAYRLERAAGQNPNDLETRQQLVQLYEDAGMTKLAEFWRNSAGNSSAGAGQSSTVRRRSPGMSPK